MRSTANLSNALSGGRAEQNIPANTNDMAWGRASALIRVNMKVRDSDVSDESRRHQSTASGQASHTSSIWDEGTRTLTQCYGGLMATPGMA